MLIATQMLLVSHFENIKADLELELLGLLVVVDHALIPHFREELGANEKVWPKIMSIVSILELAINLVPDNLGRLLNYFEILVLDSAVFQKDLCLMLEVEKLWQMHLLQLL